MKLILKNIGKIENANIDLNGITVIAGENNTGKSTVGKTLFSFFNCFYNVKEQINCERKYSIEREVGVLLRDGSLNRSYQIEHEITYEIAKNIKNNSSKQNIKKVITEILDRFGNENEKNILNQSFNESVDRIFEIANISDDAILKGLLLKQINSEFAGQINNIYSNKPGRAELIIKDEKVFFDVENNNILELNGMYDLHTEVIYIDNPFVLDEQRYFPLITRNGHFLDHKEHLIKKLFYEDSSNDVINKIISEKKFNDIYDKVNTVCSGTIIRDKRFKFGYRKGNSDKIIDIKNISAGLKTFVILKTLLSNGTLQYNGTIILDEPEIHLHPQWQILFAELIVLIQKEFKMHILLNTHSPYFLKAIEIYSAKYEISDKCKYYLAHLKGEVSVIDDVTMMPEKIYKLLATPLQYLEDVRFKDD